MENVLNDMDDLIGKVLAGEATVQEQDQVTLWRNLHADNEKYFQQLSKIFEKAGADAVRVEFDTDAAWSKVKNQITGKENNVIPINRTPYFSRNSFPFG